MRLLTLLFVFFYFKILIGELPKQIVIETMVVEMTKAASHELGINWSFGKILPGGGPVQSGTIPFGLTGTNPELGLSAVKMGKWLIPSAKFQALETSGDLKLLANPKIAVIEKHKATITTGDEVPFTTTKIVGKENILITQFKQVGVKLTVTPEVLEDDYILLKVDTEDSGRSTEFETVAVGNGELINARIFLKRNANTTVVVKSGETFVMGGLLREEKSKDQKGIPVLSKIPGIGAIFRSKKQITSTKNLTFLITPRLVDYKEKFIIPKKSKLDVDVLREDSERNEALKKIKRLDDMEKIDTQNNILKKLSRRFRNKNS